MRNILRLGAVTLGAFTLAAPAAGSVIVIGSSPGYSCYRAAAAGEASVRAINECDQAFESGMLTQHDEVATYVNRGIVKLHGENYDAAIRDFDKAIALNPAQAESYLNKGSALLRKQESPQAAISLFTEALARRTQRPELAYFARAIAHEEAGDLKAAYLDYRRAREAAPRWELPARELSRFTVRRASGSSL